MRLYANSALDANFHKGPVWQNAWATVEAADTGRIGAPVRPHYGLAQGEGSGCAADENGRSISAEVESRLERSFDFEAMQKDLAIRVATEIENYMIKHRGARPFGKPKK